MAAEGKGPSRFAIEVLEDGVDAASFRAAIGASGGGGGDVVGPASAVDDRIATFDGTTGKLIQDSGTTLADITTALSGKSNTGHTHTASEVTDFAEAVDDRVGSLLTAGSNVTLTYNDGFGTLTIAATGGGAAAWTEYEVDFGSTPVWDATFTVTDAGVSATTEVAVVQSGKTATGRASGDALWDSITYAADPGTGSFTLYAHASPGPVVGKRYLLYQVGT